MSRIEPNAMLAVVVVSYNVRELLRACLQSLDLALRVADVLAEIVVVDNASSDGSAEMVRHDFPCVTLLASPVNLGFAGANNLGLRHLGVALDHGEHPPAVLLLNPDTTVAPQAVKELLAALDLHPDIEVVGPLLRYPDGAIQSSRRRFPTRGTLFWESTILERWWPRNPWTRHYHVDECSPQGVQRVDWLVGAALLVRTAAIERAGLLDPGYFMYSEELEWQQRIQAFTGARALYWPAAVVIHHEGKSSEQKLAQRHLNFTRSKLRYARQTFGALTAWLLARFLWLNFAVELAVEGVKWLVGHKRPLRAARVEMYRKVLQDL